MITNDALTNLEQRRSIRAYRSEQITEEELQAVLRAGSYAPTGGNTQSPTMVVVQDSDTRNLISSLNARVAGRDADPFYGAPTVIVVLADRQLGFTWLEDGALVMGNLLNAAHAVGLGSCWIHRAKEVFESEEGRKLLTDWGLDPDRYVGVGNCILGYPAGEEPQATPRRTDNIIRA